MNSLSQKLFNSLRTSYYNSGWCKGTEITDVPFLSSVKLNKLLGKIVQYRMGQKLRPTEVSVNSRTVIMYF